MRALAIAIALSGCALSHEIGVDAHVDAAASEVLTPCGTSMTGTGRDCGWSAGGAFACRPGATVQVGCAASCMIGSCTGDTMLRVCDTAPCTAERAIAVNDDSCGTVCSFIDGVTCPASGEIFVLTGPYVAGSPFSCSFAVR